MFKYFLLLISCFAPACSWEQASDGTDSPLKVILDTDMGSDCDDVGTLALLHDYADSGLVTIVATVYSSGKIPYGAGIVDAINTMYGRGDIPVGALYDTTFGDPVDKMNAQKLARDTAAYGNDIVHNFDAVEQTRLIREVLSEAEDSSLVYITIGHTRGLYDVLTSPADAISPLTGFELIEAKVQKWVAMGAPNVQVQDGFFKKDWNFWFNGSAEYTAYLLQHFSVPIHIVGCGGKIYTGGSLESSTPGNIVRDAYREWLWKVEGKVLRDQRPSWDLITVQYAVEGLGDFLFEHDKGWLEYDVEQGGRWNLTDTQSSGSESVSDSENQATGMGQAGKDYSITRKSDPDLQNHYSTVTDHHYIFNKPGTEEELSEYLNSRISR